MAPDLKSPVGRVLPSISPSNSGSSSALGRLTALGRQLIPSSPFTTRSEAESANETGPDSQVGTLHLGPNVSIAVTKPREPERLPTDRLLLNIHDPVVSEHLEWLGKKWMLGQDVFLLSPPGPYSRRLALTFAALLQLPYEIVSLHRDIGEADLLQSRNLAAGGELVYHNGPVVRAMMNGGILILEGAQRAERNILPLLNNILENREQNLPDGTHLIPADRIASMQAEQAKLGKEVSRFVPVHPNFRVIALGLPIPPYKGHPLDPPFRSRFQGRWVEGNVGNLGSAQFTQENEFSNAGQEQREAAAELQSRFYAWSSLQKQHAMAAAGGSILPPTSQLPNVPGTALPLIEDLIRRFVPEQMPPEPEEIDSPEANMTEQEKERVKSKDAEAIAASTMMLLGSAYPALHSLDKEKSKLLTELLVGVGLNNGLGEQQQAEGVGILGYRAISIEKIPGDANLVDVAFEQIHSGQRVTLRAPGGHLPLQRLPTLGETAQGGILISPRMIAQLTLMLQLHCMGRDICVLPSTLASKQGGDGLSQTQSSSSTSTSISLFASCLGYQLESLHLFKDTSGQELLMRRATTADGSTTWEAAPLLKGALDGKLVHLSGVDTLGATLGSLSRLSTDRESELWNGSRVLLSNSYSVSDTEAEALNALMSSKEAGKVVNAISPSFRIVATAAAAKADWLDEEAGTLFGFVQPSPMQPAEEREVIRQRTHCGKEALDKLLEFAERYRQISANPNLLLQKSRRLGTRQLIRAAKRMAKYPDSDLHNLISRSLLVDFLPKAVREIVRDALAQCHIYQPGVEGAFQYQPAEFMADPEVSNDQLTFCDLNNEAAEPQSIPLFDVDAKDPEGKILIPVMPTFYNNHAQSMLMRSMAQDLHMLSEHLLLMGQQGVAKNAIIDRLLELLRRPREYIQLHRDSTVASILQQINLQAGKLNYTETPLLRAIRLGRVIVVDEADKSSAAVTAVFKSLTERGELSLPDGRRVRPIGSLGANNDILVHPDFRLILLANRPGFPFLGNEFLQVLGEGFSCYVVSNPDLNSEIRILQQAAPNVSKNLIRKLDMAFHDLRQAFVDGLVTYPYSLRELLHLVRHLQNYPEEGLTSVLLNTLAFDLHRPEAMQYVISVLKKRGLETEGLSLTEIREGVGALGKAAKKIEWDPKKAGRDTSLDRPKVGKVDLQNKPHVGGNTWRGGTGGRDTAGLGGVGGYERLFAGHDVHQVPQSQKDAVPEHIRRQAREMAREALAKKLAEEGMTSHEGATYHAYITEMAPQIEQLRNVFDLVQANAKERQWLNRQQEGELDERRLTDGLTGERAIFRRRQEAPPEIGTPQTKPKRIRFVVDVSASMYSMQFDGRLEREVKTCVMVMEALERVDPTKYLWDLVGHSGDSDHIVFIEAGKPPKTNGQKWKVVRNMVAQMQYCDSGDNTVRCLERSVQELSRVEADDYFVIALSDANLARYGITSRVLTDALRKGGEKVKSSIIFIDRGGNDAGHIARQMPGRAYVAAEMREIPALVSNILTTMNGEDSA
ncbi:hypothetical protein K437DRAFT_245730 [Tilletiaria anomala UBC 951]|uniref:VWFA domain-containing protein n=1 Tax=Tilletiaria anomala (strain ATCC 24038 / CBS 436.72 / UBC 951) TaxID=1037660 RepID=A0A066WAU2_TILAU|nr:uncharacterized protein K437DRAFT_245730 [Tilletiaria anomala UBC 951]KDN48209.1 hypothetical protein K437DRAFT_245730 [Tilletiaria anomala UBC 951]